MHHSIEIILTIKNTKLSIEDTFLEIENDIIKDHNKFESSPKFLFENNKKLDNIFNFNNLIKNKYGAINISIKVKDENLDECLTLLKDKINKDFKEHFNFEPIIQVVDKRTLKQYNIHFENILENADNCNSFLTNFKELNKKDHKKFVEYFEAKIKSCENLQKTATIDSWIKINQEIMPFKGILKMFSEGLENLSEGLENISLKDKIKETFSNIKIRSPKNK